MDFLGPVSRKQKGWFDENDEEIQGLLEEKHKKKTTTKNTRYTSVIPAQHRVRLPIHTYTRQSRLGLDARLMAKQTG